MAKNREVVVVEYINGERWVPGVLWPLIRRYRFLKKTVDTSGAYYAKSVDVEMNQIFDQLVRDRHSTRFENILDHVYVVRNAEVQ